MIFTECPYCDADQCFNYEVGDKTGFFPSRCCECNNVMWVEATCFGGTTRTHENFKKEIAKPEHENEVDAAAENSIDLGS